ncbi:AraC family transcriptional regulator [Aerococcaceae bacterium NML191292]|nr:AraC family transcriptional regulator [Aerococcaceae bacterium NML210727]MCW6654768.1 AraC family transcriptional regulator [Aerococcaceae bacterium NML201296]MCW6659016.1 AraC family transcriptional regulator [Aerococcaceae bacterium NML191292]
MNMIQSFNKTIQYVESVLEDGIDESEIARLSSYSFAMFSRLFSIMTDMTLSEYIRMRKLTKAAAIIKDTDDKIIDIAMRYGYESSDSFTNAFKKFHKVTPSQVRKGEAYKVVSPVRLTLSIKGGKNMDVKIQTKSRFVVAGIKLENIETSSCPVAWERLFAQFSHDTLARLGNGQSYGVCYDIENVKNLNYAACYDVTDVSKAKEMGLDIFEIDEAEYAILSLKGPVPECIHEGWKYAMEVFLPENNYRHSGAPDFEVYREGDMSSSDYEMELWIPIVKL